MSAPVSHWQDVPGFPVEDWQDEVAANATRLGYLEWVAEQEGPCRTCAESIETRCFPCDECGALDEGEEA